MKKPCLMLMTKFDTAMKMFPSEAGIMILGFIQRLKFYSIHLISNAALSVQMTQF